MDLRRYHHTETTTVAAPPAAVYELVADVTRMGEWSPVCTGGVWDADGVWFTGSNTTPERSWETRCRVDVADPGREFTFTNCGPDGSTELVRWSYHFAPSGDGTELTESWQVLDSYADFIERLAPGMDVVGYLDGARTPTATGMATTLANLKARAEGRG
jgi:hypothetical protein